MTAAADSVRDTARQAVGVLGADNALYSGDFRATERLAAAVRAAIARLPKKQRAALILRVYHDLPHDEIARIVGTSVGAVKANFFHALANLKKLLNSKS